MAGSWQQAAGRRKKNGEQHEYQTLNPNAKRQMKETK
jgi:hypothetical protein